MTENGAGNSEVAEVSPDTKNAHLPKYAYLLCCWPLALVAVGGALGGLLGGAASGANLAIYKSRMPAVAKIVLNVLAGLAAILIWLFGAIALQSIMSK